MKVQNGAKPFVKWVGGKTQLLLDIEQSLPANFSEQSITYIEPFVGGGAVMFYMLQRYPNIQYAVINDINERLINTYRIVKSSPEDLVYMLSTLEQDYLPRTQEERTEYFLRQRQAFNEEDLSDVERAALFIFLNRTCFNGLYRENSKGKFNVPHGRYSQPKICDEATIMADAELLQRVEILCGDFARTECFAGQGVLYYFDPPYKPISDTSSFNSYVKEPFDDAEQERLRNFCNAVAEAGSLFLLSNSDATSKGGGANFFEELYAEYDIRRVWASRMVNANPQKRGKLTELMISNINMQYNINIPTDDREKN